MAKKKKESESAAAAEEAPKGPDRFEQLQLEKAELQIRINGLTQKTKRL
jgi:hypothetical protein